MLYALPLHCKGVGCAGQPVQHIAMIAEPQADHLPLGTRSILRAPVLQVTYLAGWGGGLTSAIILNKPLELPVSMFVNHHDVVIVAVWWLANYFPYGGPGYLLRLPPVQWASMPLLQMLRASTLCKVMTMTRQYYPNATIAVLVMGSHPRLPLRQSKHASLPHLSSKYLEDAPIAAVPA